MCGPHQVWPLRSECCGRGVMAGAHSRAGRAMALPLFPGSLYHYFTPSALNLRQGRIKGGGAPGAGSPPPPPPPPFCFFTALFSSLLTCCCYVATPGLASSARNTVRCLKPNGLGTRPRSSIPLRVRMYYVRERHWSKEEAHGGPGTCNPRTSGTCSAKREGAMRAHPEK